MTMISLITSVERSKNVTPSSIEPITTSSNIRHRYDVSPCAWRCEIGELDNLESRKVYAGNLPFRARPFHVRRRYDVSPHAWRCETSELDSLDPRMVYAGNLPSRAFPSCLRYRQ